MSTVLVKNLIPFWLTSNGNQRRHPRTQAKEFDAKESMPLPEEFKNDAEKLLDCREVIAMYQSIVMDQEIQLVNLQVEASLRAGEFKELQTELEWYKSSMEKRNSDA